MGFASALHNLLEDAACKIDASFPIRKYAIEEAFDRRKSLSAGAIVKWHRRDSDI
jgi:hypothetical protein